MMNNQEKIHNQIDQINNRIFRLNDIIYELNSNPLLNISELNKAEKSMAKLVKDKGKLLKKIQKDTSNEGALYDKEWETTG